MDRETVAGVAVVVPTSRADSIPGLYEHGPVLLAAARVITLDEEEARDLVQATFEIAIRNVKDLRDPHALRAWLLRIEAREAFRVMRRVRRLVRLDSALHDAGVPAPDVPQHADLWIGLETLPRRTRAAVALHYLAGFPVRETAAALGVSENTVKSQLRTGLGRLREVLRDE
jgi:RNA polymerase sigma-70 factor (ECF subfamily)